jgi:hypothetical protein
MNESEKKVYEETLARLKASPAWSKRDEKELEEIARNAAMAAARFPKSDPSIPPAPPAAESEIPSEATLPPEETLSSLAGLEIPPSLREEALGEPPPATEPESPTIPAKTASPSEIFAADLIPKGWSIANGVDVPPTLMAPSDLEFVKFVYHEKREKMITGRRMRLRAKEMGANFGLADLKFVLGHQDNIPEELRDRLILFPGTLLWDPDPNQTFLRVPGIEWENNRWVVKFHWFSHEYGEGSRFVVRRKPSKT